MNQNDPGSSWRKIRFRIIPDPILYLGLFVICLFVNLWVFLPDHSVDAFYVWYADFRFWPDWVRSVCRLVLIWGAVSMLIAVFLPKNDERLFLIRRSFIQKALSVLFVLFIWLVWYNRATLPLATLFAPILSPFTDYVYRHYTLPLADYYTTGEGSNPLFWPTVGVIAVTVLFVTWRVWFYVRRWKNKSTSVMVLALIGMLPIMLGAEKPVPSQPKKVETSVGIYDIQSKEDIDKFTTEEIRELVKMEDDRTRGNGLWPHPVLVYCFEEYSFTYTGGKYENAEIKYRMRVPSKIVPGKKYPLVLHLHGSGEAGNDNTMSLAHLHSILPLLIGPEQQDFFLLIPQCPRNDRLWKFSDENDGNLDIALALMQHVIDDNPIDEKRLSTFGLSSGGYGVWRLIMKYPDLFAAAVPTSCAPPNDPWYLKQLRKTSIWSFCNKNDGSVKYAQIYEAMQNIRDAGGKMKFTRFDQGGHAAWRPAMDEYNCFAWMIAQKRGGWFNPPPERKVYQGRSLSESFYAFFLPLLLAGGLFLFQKTALCERLHEGIADRLYHRWDEDDEDDEYEDDDEDEEDDEEESDDGFRIFTDITGTKKIKAKVLGFQGDIARLQLADGKIEPVAIKHFSETDQEWLRKIKPEPSLPEGFRRWTNFNGTQSFIAKFVGFQGDDKVLLQSQAGKTAPVPINQLGKAEQEFLATQREQSPVQPLPDGFRIWTDNTGTKKITAKLVDFLPDGKVRLEFQTGKITTVDPKFFCEADQRWLQEQKPTT